MFAIEPGTLAAPATTGARERRGEAVAADVDDDARSDRAVLQRQCGGGRQWVHCGARDAVATLRAGSRWKCRPTLASTSNTSYGGSSWPRSRRGPKRGNDFKLSTSKQTGCQCKPSAVLEDA